MKNNSPPRMARASNAIREPRARQGDGRLPQRASRRRPRRWQGRIVEVKEAKAGSAARLHAELPFRMTLPDAAPVIGKPWDRGFTMKLDPPLGTGESFEFLQKFTPAAIADGLLSASVETTLRSPPKALGERVPLVPMLWTGNVYFNTRAGKYQAARLKVKAELLNYQGEGTKFEYESVYNEDAVDK